MFQSISYANDKHTIIDSDFQETFIDDKYEDLIEHIIEIYSKRNLNVALNLILYMQFLNKENPCGYSIDDQISDYKEYVKDFDKYLPEINKYLSLI